MSIIVKGLTKIYGTQKAVNNLTFEIKTGEVVGFLGPNGAGKSTTMKMLTTFTTPTQGTASVAGFDIQKHPIEVKKKVGYLPESNPLYYDMYVREYLKMAAKIHQIGNIKNRIEEVINLTGLNKEAHKKIGQLSKGYKQRVGIAQAIIHNPDVLILDEPTSGLDPNQLEEIRQLIIKIGKDKAVMISTHIMQEVEAICDRVIIIKDGNIVKDDSMANAASSQDTKAIAVLIAPEHSEHFNKQFSNKYQIKQLATNHFLIFSDDLPLLKKEIMSYALQNEVEIKSIQDHHESLEEVFKKVTK